MRRGALLTALALGLSWAAAHALEFRSIKDTGVAFYDAPALSAKKLFLVSRYYPVEVLSLHKEWARVRDATGGIAWVPATALSTRRWALVTADQARVRATPAADGQLRFTVARDGVLEPLEVPKDGWVKVRHHDGSEGYARIGDLWGL